ncbi:hypothetical protein RDWZM_002206 [Blomia tropicalis]|uniref:peptidyl-tRNA hydrolase n=1 Tax=Blomia tropicalis TaxID=40697 RepID=A0A9Q0RS05_BLOTA|nr:hypothetical protein RDWZM_002206 [Blomia tropicalis]
MDHTDRGVPDGTDLNSFGNATATTATTSTMSDSSASNPPVGGNVVRPMKFANQWKPDEKIVSSLTLMGISPTMAEKALYYTKNVSAEVAIEWIFENQDASKMEIPLDLESRQHHSSTFVRIDEQDGIADCDDDDDDDDDEHEDENLYKMVFVVNAELSMGVGKIAAQVAHAAMGLHRILLQHQAKYGESLLSWAEYGETKIVLRGDTTEHLISLEHRAINQNLPCYLVHDAGKTQVRAGSTTVLAIFGNNYKIDRVTGSLKLY